MAFSIGKMFSKINYFKKEPSKEDTSSKKRRHTNSSSSGEMPHSLDIQNPEADSTTINCATSLKFPDSVKTFVSKKGSLSETDLLKLDGGVKTGKRRYKKLKLDIGKANKSMSEALDLTSQKSNGNIENTPTHISLSCKSSEMFCERLRDLDFNHSFDMFDAMSEGWPDTPEETENFDIKSLSEHSDSDTSMSNQEDKTDIKMCRKVESVHESVASIEENRLVWSATPESFGDVELDKNEEERITLLLSYQMELEKMERFLKKLLTEFQFHIEVSKIFHCKSMVTALPGSDVSNAPKMFGEITYIDTLERSESPTGSWNMVVEKEDTQTKFKLKNQLLSMKHFIEEFIDIYLNQKTLIHEPQAATPELIEKTHKYLSLNNRSITFDLKEPKILNRKNQIHESQAATPELIEKTHKLLSINNRGISFDLDEPKFLMCKPKRLRINNKKKYRRHNDYPDLNEALQNLFSLETEQGDSNVSIVSGISVTDLISSIDEKDLSKCTCRCQYHRALSPVSSQSDSGLITKTGDDRSLSQSITSSIGNFTLDSSTLTAYSESLDLIISYNSFQETSLYSTMLQKAAIERITFYVQVHSIQLKCETNERDFESKNVIIFFCPACSTSEGDEHGLLKHILSQKHCEKIHFLYKTAYIKKCFASGKEIQPSTVLNPMTMYRDDNKIVCFGDAMYACSLCFENLIVGESILMAHCAELDHQEKRDKLCEVLE